jgi:RecA/RadA recombinase
MDCMANKKVPLRLIHKKDGEILSLLAFISTGSAALDSLLGGGVRAGFVTDVYGESGSGKSQLCFTLCANCVRAGGSAIFIDTAGTFRPERISEIAGKDALDKITFIRALNSEDQIGALNRAREMDVQLLIVDMLTSLFSAEYAGPARHLAVMSHLRDLAVYAIDSGCAVVVTNMVRNAPAEGGPAVQREYLGSSVSIYSHAKIRLAIENPARGAFNATLVQPPAGSAPFSITASGISDRASA